VNFLVKAGFRAIFLTAPMILGCLGGCATAAHEKAAASGHVEEQASAVAGGQEKAVRKSSETGKPEVFGAYLAAENAALNSDSAAAAGYYLETLKNDPDNILLQQKAYAALIGSARYEEARPVAEALTKEKSATNLPQFFLVLYDIRDGKYTDAQKALADIPDIGFQSLLNPLVRAWILAGQGKTDDAVLALDKLDQTPLFRPFRRNHRALLYAYGNKKTEAELAFKESLNAEGKGSLRTILAYGRFLNIIGRTYEAKALYQEYAKLYPDELSFSGAERQLEQPAGNKPFIASPAEGLAEALYSMASALAVDNATGPAAYYLRLATFLKPDFADAYVLLGRLLEVDKNYALAINAYDRVSADDVLDPEARLRKAWALNQMGKSEEALVILNDLVNSDAKSISFQVSLADMLRAHDKHDEAIQHYSAALKISGESPTKSAWVLYYSRGVTFERANRWPEAEADFLKALELSPNQPEVLNYLGYSWIERGVNLEKAQGMLERAVALSPNDAFIADSLGWALYVQKKYDEAVVILEKAVLQQPEDPTLNDHLGDAYWAAGRHNEARFQWRHAISLGALPADAVKIEAKLEKGLTVKAGMGGGPVKKSRH
jgi:tetratricopeptide (TPR) repeat protein